MEFAPNWDDEFRAFVDRLLRFESTAGDEAPAQAWFRDRLESFGFETYEWEAGADRLAKHPSFPDDPGEIDTANRPSVGGVLEFGDPDAGPTLVLNGHVDTVPAGSGWSGDPFEPRWNGGVDPSERRTGDALHELTARGAADMKCGLAACVFAARHLAAAADTGEIDRPDGRVVVESVAGEEEGGIGAAAAALDNPYPFERDAAIVAEPTALAPITATEGSLMARIRLEGRSAHAATRWKGESVLPHFERIRRAFLDLEAERSECVRHPLYEGFDIPWPVCFGTVEAGTWASTVPDDLVAEVRVGVAPGESVDDVETEFAERLAAVAADDPWLAAHPPSFDRFSIQFEPAETDPAEPIVDAVEAGMSELGLEERDPRGATYGADSRHYVAAGIPTVLFGPGNVEQAHFPDETIDWSEVLTARDVLARAARTFLDRGTQESA